MDGFKKFLLRGNVVDLAVAVVIGAAFGAIVLAFTKAFITPLIGLIAGEKGAFSDKSFSVHGTVFPYGPFVDAVISFIIIAAVVYFLVVRPVAALLARYKSDPPVDETQRDCPHCLSKIPVGARRCAFCTQEVAAV